MDEVYTYQGRNVRVISRDSDPTCDVLVVWVDDPDTDFLVAPSDLSEVQA